MQYIDIFLASSIDDLHNERMELGNYIRVLNDIYQSRGIYFRLHMCEDISDELSEKRSQEVYNDVIKKCDYFYIICWHKAGQYTLEEFDVALEQFKGSGKAPKITTFFKQTPEPAEAVRKFMERLDGELQHYYTVFDSIDSVKLKILLEMAQRPELQMQVACQDAKLSLNGQEVTDIHMDRLPFYANHDKITELREQLEQLNNEFIDIKLQIAQDPQNDELFTKLYKISGEKNKTEEELHRIETDLLKLASRVVEMSSSGEYLTQRAKTAMQLFEQGKVKEALVILDDEERRRDAQRTAEKAAEIKKEYRAYVKECQLKIDGLKSEGVTAESAGQIVALYEEIEGYVRDGGLDRSVLVDYMNFLRGQNDHQKALKKGEELYHYFKSTDVDELDWAWFCNDYAVLHQEIGRFDEAESLYSEALEIFRKLVKKNSTYEHLLAMVCINFGNLYNDLKQYDKAEGQYYEALEIYQRLAKDNPADYEANVASVYHDLAVLYRDTMRYDEAERLDNESLRIYLRLAETDPQTYEPDVAMSYNSLGILYKEAKRYDEAEKMYYEALEIRRRSAKKNPREHEPELAKVCNNIANLYSKTHRSEEAISLLVEALDIYRKLAKDDPQAFEAYVADICNNLGILYKDSMRTDEAEKMFNEALEIRRKLAKDNPRAFENYLADTCNQLGTIYKITEQSKEAEKLYSEALEISRRLAKDNPRAFEHDVAQVCYNLAGSYMMTDSSAEAEKLYNEALEIYRRLAKSDPQTYGNELADTCNDLGLLYKITNQHEKAEPILKEALEAYRRLAKADPQKYEPDVARTCNNIALILHTNADCCEETEKLYSEALEIYRRLAKENSEEYEKSLAITCYNLAILLYNYMSNREDEAEALYNEALEIKRRLEKG